MEEEGEDGGGEVRSLPKLVAMSATIDATSFAAYLADGKGDAPVVRVPGRLFPVRCLHLEEVAAPALDEPTCMQYLTPLITVSSATQVLAETRFGRGAARGGRDGMPAEVDWALLTHLVEHIATAGEPGAILVFLSGAREIERCCSALRSRPSLRGAWVRPLHGSLSPAEQRRAFEAPPPPTRKVVVSTNVAETSVTIGDVVHVVDCGLAKATSRHSAPLTRTPLLSRFARPATPGDALQRGDPHRLAPRRAHLARERRATTRPRRPRRSRPLLQAVGGIGAALTGAAAGDAPSAVRRGAARRVRARRAVACCAARERAHAAAARCDWLRPRQAALPPSSPSPPGTSSRDLSAPSRVGCSSGKQWSGSRRRAPFLRREGACPPAAA